MKGDKIAQKLVAIMIFAAFLAANVPSLVSAGNVVGPVNENVSDVVEQPDVSMEVTTDNLSEMEQINSNDIMEIHEDNHAMDTHIQDKNVQKESREKPSHIQTEKKVNTPNTVIPPMPNYVPRPPTTQWTTVSGAIGTQTWTLAGSPYYVTGDITIPLGNTLTINSGVQVLFNGSYQIAVNGTLNAIGTIGSHISFANNFPGFWQDVEFDSTGAGTLTYIDFDGATNAVNFNNANNTVPISYCTFTNNANYGIWFHGASTAGMNVHDNTFDTTGYSLYEDLHFSGLGSTTVGSRIFTDNTINGSLGYYSNYIEFDTPMMGANIAVGITQINDNTFTNTQQGISINYYYVHDMEYGTVDWGNVEINRNFIHQSSNFDALYFYGDIYENSNITVNIGSLDVSGNNVTNTGLGYAIYVDYWDFTELHGTTSCFAGPVTYKNNNLNSTGGSSALYTYNDAMGDMYDYSSVTLSDFTISGNTVWDSGSGAIYLDNEFGYTMYDYSSITAGDFYITDNTIYDSSSEGIYDYWYYVGYDMYDHSRVVAGDTVIANNNVTSSGHAMYVYLDECAYEIYQNTYVSIGMTDISYNVFNSSNNYGGYVYIDYMGSYMYGNSQAWFGDFSCQHNNFISTAGEYALYISDIEDIAYELYGNSQVHYGDILFNWNNIDGWHYGFYCSYYGYNGYDMYDNSYFEIGDFEVNHNTIISNRDPGYTDGDGLYFASDDIGCEMWGNSQVIMDHMEFNDNNIHVMNGADADGMYFSYIDDYGSSMYGQATFEMTGNIEICRNWVNATPGYYGIYYDIYDMGYEMYGDNSAIFQNFLINDNTIWADDYGIESYFDYSGYDLYGNDTVVIGDLELNNNTVWSDGQYGIYSDWYDLASELYGTSMVTIGQLSQNDNIINATSFGSAYGWHCDLYDLAYDVYEQATTYFGNYEFLRNTINSTGYGVYFDWYDFASDGYGYSKMYFGDFSVNDNHINSTGNTGIYWTDYIYDVCYDMYEDSYAVFGDFYCMDNDVVSNDYGIYASSEYVCGYYLEDNAYARVGDVIWTGNNVNNSGTNDGIYFYMYELGYYLDYNAEGHFGDVHVDNNTVVSGGDGIYVEFYECGYDMYESTIFTMGDITINDNIIDTQFYNGDDGIYMEGLDDVGYDVEDNAYFEMGIVEVARNNIDSNSDGIYWDYYYEVGYDIYDNAQAYFGDVLVTDNNITCDGDGIYLNGWYDVGYDVYDTSYVQFGNFKFNRNTINATDDGIYFSSFYDWGGYMDYNAEVYFGDFEFNNNDIQAYSGSSGYGIYMEPYEFGYYNDDSSLVTMGDWTFNYNTITSYNNAMYLDFYEFGYDNYGTSELYCGDHYVVGNTLNSTDAKALEDWWLYEFGYYMYEDSYAEFGNTVIANNDLTSWNDYGFYGGPEYFGYYVYDTSDVVAGDYYFINNTVYSDNDYGIYFYFYEIGYELYDDYFSYSSSTVTIGDVKLNDNHIYGGGDYAIYIDYEYMGYDIYYDSAVTVGNMEVMRNNLTGYDGIYFYYDEIGYDVYNTATVTVGWVDISENEIDVGSNNAGIYFDSYGIAGDIEDNSRLIVDDILIHDNTIFNAYRGIQLYNDWSQYVHNYAYVEMPTLKVYDNTVNCSDYGLYIEYYSDTTNVDATATSIWNPWEIYQNTFTSDYGMYVDSNDNPALPRWDVHDNDFTGPGSNNGLYIRDVDPANPFVVRDCTFDNFDYGINAQSGAYIRAISCNITNMTTNDVYLDTNSNAFMIDCNFNKSSVNYVDAASTLDIGWLFDVYTETPTGTRIPYVDLEAISSGAPVITENDKSDATGHAEMMLRESRHNQANPFPAFLTNFNDHNITATKSINTGWAIPEVNVSGTGGSTIIILGDSLSPTLGADASDSFGSTGDPFRLATGAGDDMGISNVQVYYRVNSGGWSNSQMTFDGIWMYSFNVPHQLGTIEYYFVVTDIGGNSVTGTSHFATIYDNDAPSGYVDNTWPIIYSSTPNLQFSVGLTDNIAMGSVYLHYWYPTESPTTVAMSGTNPYTYSYAIDFSKSMIYYYVTSDDAAGNRFTGPTEMTIINDTDVPVLVQDLSDTNATTGDPFHFEIQATDNIDIVNQTVTYWFGTGASTTETLTEGTPDYYSQDITIPSNSTDSLNYYFTLVDNSGNVLVTYVLFGNTTVTVVDDDFPTQNSDGSDNTATTGDVFTFKATGDDNVGIASIEAIYWYGTGTATTKSLSLDMGMYTGTIIIPAGMVDSLHYYIVVTDTSGNSVNQTEKTIVVYDNDAPVAGTDTSDTTAVTGVQFDFEIAATDNIGVSGAHLIYWYGSGTETNVTLTGSSPYAYNITIPASATNELHYYFAFSDAAGNWAVTPTTAISITDNSVPVFGTDSTPTNITEGEDITFSIEASDNVGITSIVVVYWTDTEGEYAYAQLTLVGDAYVGTVSVPNGTVMHYYFMAIDGSGNTASTPEKTVNIHDNGGVNLPPNAETSFFAENWWIVIVIILVLIIIIQAVYKGGKPKAAGDESIEEPETEPISTEENRQSPEELE